MFVLVAYDVPANRTQVYKKALQKLLPRLQDSVFAGRLPESRKAKLDKALQGIYCRGDRVIMWVANNARNIEQRQLELDGRGHGIWQETADGNGSTLV